MSSIAGKKVILGISGSIAAYKAAFLIRLLVKQKAEVQVIMSASAQAFISPLTLSTLSTKPVLSEFVKDETGVWNNHVDLALWADLILIAPATAHTMARCAHALSPDLLSTVYLSAKCPVAWAPAMDRDMYLHPANQKNLAKLASYGDFIIPSEEGELASGLRGKGRMAEPEHIVEYLENFFQESQDLSGKTALVTAGPTQESLDPVRFISNHSSGKMGYALAQQLAKRGAQVHLVSGPTTLSPPSGTVALHSVRSAAEMFEQCSQYFPQADISVLAAAVADYTPVQTATQKIKKKDKNENLHIELKRTVDIAQTLGQIKQAHQLLVGFALETQNEIENALSKLSRKNFDMIVLNSLNDAGAGFRHNTNQVTLIRSSEDMQKLPLLSKEEVARHIVNAVINLLNNKPGV